MERISFTDLWLAFKRVCVGFAAAFVIFMLLLTMLWRDRVALDDIPMPHAPAAALDTGTVTIRWFGVSTLLIDDGTTQILIDGFISRPPLLDVLSQRPVFNDVATINRFLFENRINRLAAIIPSHSHFDHAMDVGAIANRSSASILGSETTANIARGAGVPEDQIVVIEDGAEYSFGDFSVRLIESVHAPIGWGGSVPMPGEIDAPLEMPAPIGDFRAGTSYSIVVMHPLGSLLVQGSAGFREIALEDLKVDTVMLSVGLLEGLGRDYIERYWQKLVTSTGARVVVPVHFDDYTRPFGQIELAPRFLDNFSKTVRLLTEFRDTWDSNTRLYLPQFGVPFELYPQEDPEV